MFLFSFVFHPSNSAYKLKLCLDGDVEGASPATEPWLKGFQHNQHAFTTGRRHIPQPKTRPKGSAQTLKVFKI